MTNYFNKNRIMYIIKHNKFFRFLYEKVLGSMIRFYGFFVKVEKNQVLIVPNTGKNFSGSTEVIYRKIRDIEKLDNLKIVIALNNPEKYEGKEKVVKLDSLEYFKTALKSKYWIADINVERGLKFKSKKNVFLNTWHGTALKKIGNDDPNSGNYDYSDINYLCVSSEYDEKVYKTALNANSSSYLRVGAPINDRLVNFDLAEKNSIREKLNIPKDKKVIMYAPTWRDSSDGGSSFGIEIPIDVKKWEEKLSEEYVVLFRAHSRTTTNNIEFNDFIRDASNYEDLDDLMIITDVLISDYSSIVIDYSILERPFFCFAYDYEEYLQTRGFYIDIKDIYTSVGFFKKESELLEGIINMNNDEKVKIARKIKNEYMTYMNGDSADKCVEALFKI